MAILTVQQTLLATRVVASIDDIPQSILDVANTLYPGSIQLVDHYAPFAPDSVKNIAIERLFGWLWEADLET